MHKELKKYPPEFVVLGREEHIFVWWSNTEELQENGYEPVYDEDGCFEQIVPLSTLLPFLPRWVNYIYVHEVGSWHGTKEPLPIMPNVFGSFCVQGGDTKKLACYDTDLPDKKGEVKCFGEVDDFGPREEGQSKWDALVWMRHIEPSRIWWKDHTFKELTCTRT